MATATKTNTGQIVQIIGPVLDVQFSEGHLPEIFGALKVRNEESKTDVIAEIQQHLGNVGIEHAGYSVFCGVGERTREGTQLLGEMEEAGVLEKMSMVFGQMNEPPGARLRVGLTGLTIAEYFRDDEGKDVLLFVDNVFRLAQEGSEVSALLGRMPSAVGYQPTLSTEMGELQERITSTKKGSITSLQAVFIPADDYTDPAPVTTFAHLDSVIRLERSLFELGLFPAADPLTSTSRALDPRIVGEEHYRTARDVQRVLPRYKDLKAIIAILGVDELSDQDKTLVARARKLQRFFGQAMHTAVRFTGLSGDYVRAADTVRSVREILDGKADDLPEQAFYMVGTIEDARANAESLAVAWSRP